MPLQYLKNVSNETKESKGYVQPYKKIKKVLCFVIVLIQIISSSKFSFKEKNYIKLISFNFLNKTFMQKGTDQRSFNFFSFGTQNQFAHLKVYYIASINRLKIDKN